EFFIDQRRKALVGGNGVRVGGGLDIARVRCRVFAAVVRHAAVGIPTSQNGRIIIAIVRQHHGSLALGLFPRRNRRNVLRYAFGGVLDGIGSHSEYIQLAAVRQQGLQVFVGSHGVP